MGPRFDDSQGLVNGGEIVGLRAQEHHIDRGMMACVVVTEWTMEVASKGPCYARLGCRRRWRRDMRKERLGSWRRTVDVWSMRAVEVEGLIQIQGTFKGVALEDGGHKLNKSKVTITRQELTRDPTLNGKTMTAESYGGRAQMAKRIKNKRNKSITMSRASIQVLLTFNQGGKRRGIARLGEGKYRKGPNQEGKRTSAGKGNTSRRGDREASKGMRQAGRGHRGGGEERATRGSRGIRRDNEQWHGTQVEKEFDTGQQSGEPTRNQGVGGGEETKESGMTGKTNNLTVSRMERSLES
ncbi:hypothetical protein BC829DRAFT_421521 [Chytridium lagenaria]|nr:hypothetical protein BC829DRAFT_421521 [Chytridium lagenaria]